MNDTSALRDALTRELTRAQTVTGRRSMANQPQVRGEVPPAVPTVPAGANNIAGVFMIGVSKIGGNDIV